MTKNEIQCKQPLVSRKDHPPGCMGRMFELNQAVVVSRLLTDRKHGEGLKNSRNCLDASNRTFEAPESSDVRREDKPNSTTKMKGSATPMKTLIEQEFSKKKDSKCRPPSVVARLMGLDALPAESILTPQVKTGEKKLPRKQKHDVQFSSEKVKILDSMHMREFSVPKSVGKHTREIPFPKSDGKHTQELSFPKSQQQAMNHPDEKVPFQAYPFGNNSQEKQWQEFGEDSGTWQGSMFRDYKKSAQVEKLNVELVDKQMLDHEKSNEKKMALVRQKFMDAKRLATDEKLQQSKEFLDALEILQSNKDLFLKFLQEPNSLFAKHIQDLRYTSQHVSQPKQITILKSLNSIKTCELLKEEVNGKERCFKQGKKNEKQFKQQKGPRHLAERNKSQELRDSHPVCLMHDQYRKHSAASANHKDDVCSLPTRIVVLKPSPGKVQQFKPVFPLNSSPQSQTLFRDPGEIKRAGPQDYLHEVRVKLEQGIRENNKDSKSKSTVGGVQEGFSNRSKCPREIATEIARQVRERVNTDLRSDTLSSGELVTSLTGFAENISSRSRSVNSFADVDASSDMEIYTPVNKHSCDISNRFSPPSPSISRLPDSPQSTVNREAKKRLLERWRLMQGNEEEQQVRRISNTLRDMLALPESKNQVLESKSLRQNNKGSMGVGESQAMSCHMLEIGCKNKRPIRHEVAAEWEGSLGPKNGDHDKDISPRHLLRSRSVPTSATSYHEGDLEMQGNVSTAHEIGLHRSSDSLPKGLIKPKNEKSIFKGKVSGLKGSFLLRGRRSNIKTSDSLDTLQPNGNFQLQRKELRGPLQEMAVESDQWKDKLGCVICSPEQDRCKFLIDGPEITTESVEHSSGTRSEMSPKSDGGPVLEVSDRDPICLEGKTMLCAVDTDDMANDMAKAIPSGQLQIGSPIPCSPTKELLLIGHNASENDGEKGEHPSPISVLDLPFQEEFSSPKEFKEISSNLHELRLRLHLLKFEASERSGHKIENLSEGGMLAFEDQDIGEADLVTENSCDSASEAEMPPMPKSLFPAIETMDFESLKVDDILCSQEKQADLLYIRNVLVASGFTGDCDMVFARWHSPSYPLDPCLFEKTDDLCRDGVQCEMSSGDNELTKGGVVCRREANRSKSEGRLLYDCINEVLLEVLGPFINPHPWVRPTKMNLRPMPAGKQLLKEMWATICPYIYPVSEVQHTLENLVARDLAREVVWMELRDDIETVGCEIEKTIFNDLLEEVLCDLVA